ncbi:rhodanese-like domain-containing protein [Pseudoalteromonas piscicida]|uniref:Rhodanese-like domain-containing protein n=1 Tax=Pseudoalteromonas piscicida TaxID=43662 RepID=A0A2A5JNE7_PSEO7|nr:rhodanese-like domain-containing protein [Pseudoalteromonas piscicida]PCK30897.1 rhodanese-like domain-containing protein [Pseudoalteromonas piscicida]
MNNILIALLLLLSGVCMAQSAESISQQQLLVNQMSQAPYTIVDVRSPEEFAAGHIKGAINIPFNEIDSNQDKLLALTEQPLVVYCRSGRRAGIFIEALSEKGYSLKHLAGDIQKWQENSLPLVKE